MNAVMTVTNHRPLKPCPVTKVAVKQVVLAILDTLVF